MIEGCWHGGAGGDRTTSKASYVIGEGSIFDFLHLVLSWKKGQKLRNSVDINQILTEADCYRSWGLTSQSGHCRLWVRVPFPCLVRPLCVGIFSLSESRDFYFKAHFLHQTLLFIKEYMFIQIINSKYDIVKLA